MVFRLRAVALLAASACAPITTRSAADAHTLVITGVRVVDIERGTVSAPATIVLRDGLIVSVDSVGAAPPQGARRIDARGRYVLPGLWDLHVHLGMAGREALPILLDHGVTGVRDMGGPAVTLAWRDSIAAGTLVGPRVVAAGTVIENKRWRDAVAGMLAQVGVPRLADDVRARFGIDAPADAPRIVDSLKASGADVIKIRNYPQPATSFALLRAARTAGLRVVGHSPPLAQLGALSDSGLFTLEHQVLGPLGGRLIDALGTLQAPERRTLFERLARNGTVWVPTTVISGSRFASDSALSRVINAPAAGPDTSVSRLLTPLLRQAWADQLGMRKIDRDTLTNWREVFASTNRMIREAASAGVLVGAGTDLGVPMVYPGRSLHDELERLVLDAKLTPREALASATVVAAHVAGLPGRSGVVAPGAYADLLLTTRNPLTDISAIRTPWAVIARGSLHTRN